MDKNSNLYLLLKVLFILAFLPLVLIWYVWEKTDWSKRNKWLATAGIAVVFLFILFASGEKDDSQRSVANSTDKIAVEQKPLAVAEKSGEIAPQTETLINPENAESDKNDIYYTVLNVIDGDTVAIEIDGKKEVLRLIGINTPETVDPRKPVECFGQEASKEAKDLLSGKKVSLEVDPTQGELDKYNRLLRFVFLEDGTNFNKKMIEDGYAYEYTYTSPYKYQADFKAAEQKAKDEKRGLWAADTCNGKLTQTETVPAASPVVEQKPAPAVQSPASSGGTYACSCSKTCPQMSSCAEAQYQLKVCGCSQRDADHDGVACDSDCQ